MTYASLGELASLDQDSHEITADLTRLLRRWALEPDTEQDVREKVLRAVDEMDKLDPETVDMQTGDPFEKFNEETFLELLTNFLDVSRRLEAPPMAAPKLLLQLMSRISNSIRTCHALTLNEAISESFLAELPTVNPKNTLYWVVAFGSLGVALHNNYFDVGRLSEGICAVRAAALRTAASIAHTLSTEILIKRQDLEPEHELWTEAQSLAQVHLLLVEAPSNCSGIHESLTLALSEIKKTGTSRSVHRHVETDAGCFIKASIEVLPILNKPSFNHSD